jgi:hypothetical protein
MLPILTRMLSLRSARSDRGRVYGVACVAVLGAIIAGCSGGSGSGAKTGSISVTSSGVTGQVTSLVMAATVQLSMMPTGDSLSAGVDWVVACGGNPITGSTTNGSCGTLTPAHTADGAVTIYTAPSVIPIGATVTITASVTQNPSQNSSVTLTILPLPIVVSFYSTTVPEMLAVGATTSVSSQVTNDLTGAGVIWTVACGSSSCGSFSQTATPSQFSTTYTAPAAKPAGGTVTITATSVADPTKSVSATITIGAAASSGGTITISLSLASFYAQTSGTTHTTHLTAIVANSTAGVDWTVSCGSSSCGTISPAHTASGAVANFQAPSTIPTGNTVTITAKSTDDPTVAATAIATIVTAAPIVVTMSTTSAPPATLPVGSQATLAATVSSGTLGVDWTATCGSAGACGTFSLSPAHTASGGEIIYTAPSKVPTGGVVTITASSSATPPSNSAAGLTTIVAQPPSLTFAQSPPAALAGGAQAPVSAIVTNDVAPGGVTWTIQCGGTTAGACGAIVPYQTTSGGTATYTAPPVTATGTAVTINATSTADPKVIISSTPITISPSTIVSINFVPSPPSQIQASATMNLQAGVTNDSTDAGADWKVCPSGCGFFTTKAAMPAIPATATTPFVPAVSAVTAATVTAWPNNLPLPYTAPLQAPSTGSVVILVAAHASPTTAISATVAIDSGANGPGLQGTVQAGLQPVVGGSVALYAAGTSGYASISSPISTPGSPSTATTDNNGNFTIPAGYNCPQPDSQMYLLSTGGQVGTNAANQNLVLMTALGSCSSLSSSAVVLNEVTSVASAFATANFAANDMLSGNNSYLYLGTSSSNVTGLANAFAVVNNLVDISTGRPRFTVPAGNAAVPYAEINTLADALNACAASAGGVEGDGSICGSLFTATDGLLTGHTTFNSVAPADTLQAIFNIGQHPVSNYGYQVDLPRTLLGLATIASPFQPILTAQPNDWSISLNYTGGGGLSTASAVASLAVDATGNLWITDTKAGSVIEWNGIGAALSPSTGFPAGGGPIAIDSTGNIWISGDGVLTELTGSGAPSLGSPFGGVSGGGGDISIDAQSNLWITNTTGVNEFSNLGLEISPSGGYTNDGITGIGAVAVDSSNNVWIGNSPGHASLAELTNPGGQLVVNVAGVSGSVLPQVAADGAGDLWVTGGDFLCEVPPYGGKGTNPIQTCYQDDGNPNSSPQGFLFDTARGMAFDGAGVLWLASQGGGTSPNVPASVLPINLQGNSNTRPTFLASPTLSEGPLRVAVDGSGNVWVLLANNTVTEYVGVATPVVTPIALGLKNKKLGATP